MYCRYITKVKSNLSSVAVGPSSERNMSVLILKLGVSEAKVPPTVAYLEGDMRLCRPHHSELPKIFLTRHIVKNGISNLYILIKSTLKIQEMTFQRPKFQTFSGGLSPDPYNCVVTTTSPSLNSWLRYCPPTIYFSICICMNTAYAAHYV